MNAESRPAEQVDDHENDVAQLNGEAGQRAPAKLVSDAPPAETTGRTRLAYRDPRGSESTRELRDTARRRRDAEEKLQQHLLEAKDHIPNQHQGRAANHG